MQTACGGFSRLAVRRTVASIGLIDPQFIFATDMYPDQLAKLPLWDSMEWVEFFLELEQELGTIIPDQEWTQLFNPSRFSVKQLVTSFYEFVRGKS
jgi:acyl carrier protein